MEFIKNIPNIITCLNLFSGCMACVMASEKNYLGAFIFIVIAAVLDFLDGFAARLLKAYSALGKELDSLADVVSFGLAPGLVVYSFLHTIVDNINWGSSIPLIAFFIPIFSAIRLAKFNIDNRQSSSFLGLPVPANALFWSSLILSIHAYAAGYEISALLIISLLVLLFCFLMISEIPMFSLKFKSYGWKGNELQYAFLITSLFLIVAFKTFGIWSCICLYILMSLASKERINQ